MRLIVRAALILILLAVYVTAWATDTALVDRDGVTQPLVLSPANIGAASTAQARLGATYTILPYGDTRLADYYCTATDCGPAFQSALNAAKASGKGGLIKLLEGTYPVATSAVGNDAHSVIIEGVSSMGMWGDGGTIIRRTANVPVFDFSGGTPMACDVLRIHWVDASVYSVPPLKYVNAANMRQSFNYFDGIAQAIYAERPWDFWTTDNNFRSCGSGDTKDTACIGIYNGATDKAAHWTIANNRFETRPGTSIYSDATGTSGKGNDTILIAHNKFEGVDGSAYPAIHGEFWGARIIGNSIYKADTAKPPIWLTTQGAVPSGLNVVQGNRVSNHKDYAISVAGNANNIGGNTFDTTYTPTAHIRVDSGTGNKVGVNAATGSITMLSDAGTSTQTINSAAYLGVSGNGTEVATVSGAKTAGKQATFDANGNVIASAYDTGAAGGGGSGTVSSGTAGQVAYYQTDGTTVTGKTLAVGDVSGAQSSLANSAGLASALSDETGTGSAVFSDSPQLGGTVTVPATAGTNLATNGAFTSDLTGWSGNDWVWSSGKAVHNPVGTGALNLTSNNPVVGTAYRLTFDVADTSAGGLNVSFGGGTAFTVTANGSYTMFFVATATTALQFAPTASNFNGSIDNVVLSPMTGSVKAGDNFFVGSNGGAVGIGTSTPSSALEILGNGAPALPYITTYSGGDNANQTPSIVGRGARGIQSAPIQSKTGDTLMLMGGRGHDGTSFSVFSKGDIGIYAAENWTSSAQGTYINFRTAATGGTTRSEKLRINPGGMQTEGLDDKTASFTVVNSTSRITLGSGTATATLKKDLPAGTTSVLVAVAGAAASGVSFAAESGGSLSWGDAGTPTFTNSKTADVVCISENAAATSTAAWRCVKGGNF